MDFKTFLEHFDTIAQAPNGIAKLRSLILDLAVRGKLVPQNPEDEPASVLLNRIKEKKTLSHSKRESRETQDDTCNREVSFEIPKTWVWIKWADIGVCQNGRAFPSREYSSDGVKLLRPGNLHISGRIEWTKENTRYLPIDYAQAHQDFIVGANELIMNLTAQSLKDEFLGRVCLTDEDEYCLLNQRLARITPIGLSQRFCLLLFKSPLFRQYVDGLNQGTLIQHMYTSQVYNFRFPLPPFLEQKRIVEKVDELIALCDRYQQSQETQDKLRQKLRESAIASLMNAETDEELQKSWSIVRDNWRSLSQKPEDVGDLRQVILQLAVQGKLTSPVSSKVILEELLNQFQTERLSLQLSEQDKKKVLSEFDKTYKKLIKNASYLTVSARCICDFITKGTTPASNELLAEGEIPYLKVYNIVEQQLNFFYKPTYISRANARKK